MRYKEGKFSVIGVQEGLPDKIVWSVRQDPNQKNVHWIGTEEGGLVRYKGGNIKVFNTTNGKLLFELSREESMKKQGEKLQRAFNDWVQEYEQVDDVLVMGFKLG